MSEWLTGFGGVRLAIDCQGRPGDPAVLMLPGQGQTRAMWRSAARALAEAGRRVVTIDLRGQGDSEAPADGRLDLDAHVADLRAVLSQFEDRPAVVAASMGGWIASACLGEDGQNLATGLVLIDAAMEPGPARLGSDADRETIERRLVRAGTALAVPVLIVRGSDAPAWDGEAAARLGRSIAEAELVELPVEGHRIVEDQAEALNAALVAFLERTVPRAPAEYRAGSDARTLRDALGCFATGVTVVTADVDGKPLGLTANSFTSVSLDPPLLLVCIARNAGSARALEQCEHFAVNMLHIGQQPVSDRFARKVEDRFAGVEWERRESGAPIIRESLASFECARHACHDGGDHFILIGRVLHARFEPRRDPLLYFRGRYRRLHFA